MRLVIGRGFAEVTIQKCETGNNYWIMWNILINIAYTLIFSRSSLKDCNMPFCQSVSVPVEVNPASRMVHSGRWPVECVDNVDIVDIPGINIIYTITMYRLVSRVVWWRPPCNYRKFLNLTIFYVVAFFLCATEYRTYDSEPPAATRLPCLRARARNTSACDCLPESQPSPTWTRMTRQHDRNL